MSLHSISSNRYNVASTCNEQYRLQYIEGLRSNAPRSTAMQLGSVVHGLIERTWKVLANEFNYFARAGADGESLNSAIMRTVDTRRQWADVTAEIIRQQRALMEAELEPVGLDVPILFEDGETLYDPEQSMLEQIELLNSGAAIVEHLFHTEMHRYIPLLVDDLLLIEYGFTLPVTGYDAPLTGKVDMVAWNIDTQTVDLIDWKVRAPGKFWTYEKSILNPQLYLYAHVLRGMVQPDRVIQFQVLAKAPEFPKFNKPKKDGTQEVSRAKVTTTRALYMEAIRQVGGDPADYQDILDWIDEIRFAELVEVPTNPVVERRMLDVVYQRILTSHAAAQANEPGLHSFGWHCDRCQFRQICIANMLGYDVTDLIQTQFTRAEWATESDEGADNAD